MTLLANGLSSFYFRLSCLFVSEFSRTIFEMDRVADYDLRSIDGVITALESNGTPLKSSNFRFRTRLTVLQESTKNRIHTSAVTSTSRWCDYVLATFFRTRVPDEIMGIWTPEILGTNSRGHRLWTREFRPRSIVGVKVFFFLIPLARVRHASFNDRIEHRSRG